MGTPLRLSSLVTNRVALSMHHAGVELPQPSRQLVDALLLDREELQRLRQSPGHQQADDERHEPAEHEDGAPAEPRDQPQRHEPAEQRAAGEADGDAHHQRHAAALRAELADERGGVRDDAAHADPGDEPQPQQLFDGLRVGGRDGHDGEDQRGADQHRPASDLVGEHAQRERPDQHAEVGRGKHRTELRAIDLPVVDDRRADVAHRLHVEAVHDQADHAEREDANLQRTDRAVLEQLGDVDRPGRRLGHVCAPAISDFANRDPRSILAVPAVTAVRSNSLGESTRGGCYALLQVR